MSHPSSSSTPSRLHTLTLNTLGLKYISHHRRARLLQIGAHLATITPIPDIVGLQEVWVHADFLAIHEQTKHILPHAKFYHNGVLGAGLAVLSRWPIVESQMHGYPLNGRPTAFFRGDWYVGKGVAHARIVLPRTIMPRTVHSQEHEEQEEDIEEGQVLDFLTTHLHAPYEREPHDTYLVHRTAQAHFISRLIRDARARGSIVIACGDFNMLPDSLAHQLITTHGGVTDAWSAVRSPGSIEESREQEVVRRKKQGKEGVSVRWKLEVEGATCDSMANTWRWPKGRRKALERAVKRGKQLPESEAEVGWDEGDWPNAKRLDYIFLGNAVGKEEQWQVTDSTLGFTDRHLELHCSLSDHFSVSATLSLAPPTTTTTPPSPSLLPSSTYAHILHLTASYLAREHRQRLLRLTHYSLSVAFALASYVAIWWSPHNGVAFALLLVSSLWLMAGTVDGLIGFLFMGSEISSLREWVWSMEGAERRARALEEKGVRLGLEGG